MVTELQIQELTQRIVSRYHPLRIVLFGSYAYGIPDEHSDVDLLVVMQAMENRPRQAGEIRCAVHGGFPFDMIVHSEQSLRDRIQKEDSFLLEVVSKGKLLYEAPNA
jgi:predicted nucleotidyltransferase